MISPDDVLLDTEGIFERSEALTALDVLFDRLRDGYGGSAFMLGGAGLGKTAILRQAEMRAKSWPVSRAGRLLVGRSAGILFGPGHAYRFADQLFASLGADVVHGSVGSSTDARRSNRFLSALRALDDCSSRSPLLLLLDDLNWADSDSLAILEFLCRQIPTRPVVMIGTLRPWPAQAMEAVRRLELDGCSSVHELEPLSSDASVRLLASRIWGEVDSDVLDQASGSCSGNPLLIEEVARSLLGGSQVPSVEPFSTARRAILLRRFAGVSEDTFRFLRAASIFGAAFRPAVAARMPALDAPKTDAALDEAVAAGILESSEPSVRFVHPVFRGALYEGLQGPLRTELHEAAFRAIHLVGGGAGEAAEHAIAASLTDEAAISVMRNAGREAVALGAWEPAKRFLGRALQVAGKRASPDMIRELAESLVGAGSPKEAVEKLEGLVDNPDVGDIQRGRALVVLGQARLASGNAGSPLECFEEAARIFEPLEPSLCVDALLRGAFIAWFFVGPRETVSFAERASKLAGSVGKATRLQIDAAWGVGAMMLGLSEGFEMLERTAKTIEAEPSLLDEFSETGWWPLVWCSAAAAFSEQFDVAEHLFELGFSVAERKGWPAAMGAHLVQQIDLQVRLGNLQKADLELKKLESLVEQAPVFGPITMLMRSGLHLEHGLLSDAESGCSILELILNAFEHPPPTYLLWIVRIRGTIASAFGRTDEACAAFERAETTAIAAGVVEPCIAPWWVPALDGYRQAGRYSDLERVVMWLERVTSGLPCRWPRAGALAGRAMLAEKAGDSDVANKLFEEALREMEGVPMPIELCSLLTWHGAFQRRQGDNRSARRSLSQAFQLADSRGAGLSAHAARYELKLAGGRIRRNPRAVGGLTPRESQVADIASTGHTTYEIADQLRIAPKTVEHHLESVYRKLGIKSRRELMRKRFAGDLQLGPPEATSTPNPPDTLGDQAP